jgi:hypothetical protein
VEGQRDETPATPSAGERGSADAGTGAAGAATGPEPAPTYAQLLQSVAVNVALGSVTAVVVLGAPLVSALVGGVGAGALLAVWFHFQRHRTVAGDHDRQ